MLGRRAGGRFSKHRQTAHGDMIALHTLPVLLIVFARPNKLMTFLARSPAQTSNVVAAVESWLRVVTMLMLTRERVDVSG